jgi:amino acid transporter
LNFNPQLAFDFPPGAFTFNMGFLMGLGQAARVGIYDYLGYYDICYLGDEVKNPGRVIPRSIFISLCGVALIYVLINLSITGVIPWREFVPAEGKPQAAFIVSVFMERVWGSQVATLFTVMILWTTFASVFALLLGYSRVPYAAALDGTFFPVFGRLHGKKDFPYVSLLLIGVLAAACSFLSLQAVIDALITTRNLIQFIGQVVAVVLLRKHRPDMERPYRVWLYPIPLFLALAGWSFVFLTSGSNAILLGFGSLALGVVAYLIWAGRTRCWPFVAPA